MEQARERRWLISEGAIPLSLTSASQHIVEGFVETGTPLSILRFRTIDGESGDMTIKTGTGIVRDIEQGQVGNIQAVQAALAVSHHVARKIRHSFRGELAPWVVYVYQSRLVGIAIAEFKHTDEAVLCAAVPPDWMGDAVEVTDSLTSLHLARLATALGGNSGGQDALEALQQRLHKRVRKVALIAGPGAGKTGLIEAAKGTMPGVRFVPEVASIVIGQLGANPAHLSPQIFQSAVYRTQNVFEATAVEAALTDGDRLVVCDRGTVDSAGYLPGGGPQFELMFRTSMEAEFAGYDLVLFVETPPREIYDRIKAGNPNRSEDYDLAVEVSRRLYEVWQGHPNRAIISNEGGWDGKVARFRTLLAQFLAA